MAKSLIERMDEIDGDNHAALSDLFVDIQSRLEEQDETISELSDEARELRRSNSGLEARLVMAEEDAHLNELKWAEDEGLVPGVKESLEMGLDHAIIKFGAGSGEVRIIESILRQL